MSDSPSSLLVPLRLCLEQVRTLLETSVGKGKHRRALEPAMLALARIEVGLVQLSYAHERARALEAEVDQLRGQLREALNLLELQKADLDRYRSTCESLQPNQPERVPEDDLQRALGRVVESFGDTPAANELRARLEAQSLQDTAAPAGPDASEQEAGNSGGGNAPPAKPKGKKKRRHAHGRRRLDLTKLPVEVIEIDPEEVRATGGAGFTCIGAETSERIAFKPGSYFRLRIVRRKWVRETIESSDTSDRAASAFAEVLSAVEVDAEVDKPAVLVAPLPSGVWPHVMADPSALAQVILSKYDDGLPLNRHERISTRQGFHLPRSTQCGWLGASYSVCYRVVDAMFDEARAKAFCIATDATSAPVRPENRGRCEGWHVFVFIADSDHVVFRYAEEHTSATVQSFLKGFKGYLLVDASAIYDVLYRDQDIVEVCCWFHARRYFWRALESDRERALEALSLISKLFEVERACRDVPMPKRTEVRAHMAKPVLELLDLWIERNRDHVDPRGPLDKAIGYYENQRAALRRFLDDGRLRLDNNISEGALRNVVLGRHNWHFYANETGLRWYTTFRSLIASCALHGLNAQDYLEQLLRLAPHWPVTRMLELAPKYWANTLAHLDAPLRALLERPWESDTTKVDRISVLDAAA